VKNIFVTIVDILGVFVPGLLLLMGLILLPWVFTDLQTHGLTWSSFPEFLHANGIAFAVVVVIAAYVLGFLLRLWSVRLLEILTWFRWQPKLKARASIFNVAMERAIDDPTLCKALNSSNPASWAEAECMEAEIRFAAGLFVPFCILVFDGLFLRKPLGWVISAVALIGAVVVWSRFPSRRIKEVLIDYLLSIVVLRYKPALRTKS
jgi:hypothetical protein